MKLFIVFSGLKPLCCNFNDNMKAKFLLLSFYLILIILDYPVILFQNWNLFPLFKEISLADDLFIFLNLVHSLKQILF